MKQNNAPPSPVCAPLPDVGGTLVRHQDPVLLRVPERQKVQVNQSNAIINT